MDHNRHFLLVDPRGFKNEERLKQVGARENLFNKFCFQGPVPFDLGAAV